MTAVSGYTWDGLPVAPDEPMGAAIVVRRSGSGEYLILHRAHHGPGYAGDWAWTPPSGSRLPGEPVLAAARRELAEETGLQVDAADLRALDMSGAWAHFGLDVPAGAQPRLDAEHDRFEWLAAAAAIARCQPAVVADGVRLAESALPAEIAFRPVPRTDLRGAWASASSSAVHRAVVDGRDAGFMRHYLVGPDETRIDYSLGMPELTAPGVAPMLIWSYLRDVVLPVYPGVRHVVASPEADETWSIRALAKAGFVRASEGTVAGELRYRLDVAKFFGRG